MSIAATLSAISDSELNAKRLLAQPFCLTFYFYYSELSVIGRQYFLFVFKEMGGLGLDKRVLGDISIKKLYPKETKADPWGMIERKARAFGCLQQRLLKYRGLSAAALRASGRDDSREREPISPPIEMTAGRES